MGGYLLLFSSGFAGLLLPFTVLFVYQRQRVSSMNTMDYKKAITEAKNKSELIGVIIAFSQDTTLPWATFRKYYRQAHLRMLTEFKEK